MEERALREKKFEVIQRRMEVLKAKHDTLDKSIAEEEKHHNVDVVLVIEMKKQKLYLKDEIVMMKKIIEDEQPYDSV